MRVLLIFLMLIGLARADQQPQPTGAQWLAKVNQAMKSASYHGTVVFMKNGQLETMTYQHGFEDGVEYERLSSLNSPLREVIRKADEISCHFKETSKTVGRYQPIEGSMIVNLPLVPEKLEAQYLLTATGQEVVATRPAQIVAVLPKDELRYARKIWIDSERLLPLKVETYGPQGNVLEEVLFTEQALDVGDQRSPVVEFPRHRHAEDAAVFEKSAFQLNNWPAGFEILFFAPNSLQKSQTSVDRLLLSDGFASISIYFENKTAESSEGLRTFGAVNSFSRIVGDYQVTALGEVPARTVELIVNGVTLR